MRILVMDNDEEIRSLVECLKCPPRYTFRFLRARINPIAAVNDFQPDIILMEPVYLGLLATSLLEQLRGGSAFEGIGVIVISSRILPEQIVQMLDAGADDYIKKPADPNELRARLLALVARLQRKYSETVFVSGNLRVNTLSYQVHVGDDYVELPRRAFSLLVFFLRNKRCVFTADQLIEQVWGNPEITLNNVAGAVRILRQSIERNPKKPERIITKHGGYIFMD